MAAFRAIANIHAGGLPRRAGYPRGRPPHRGERLLRDVLRRGGGRAGRAERANRRPGSSADRGSRKPPDRGLGRRCSSSSSSVSAPGIHGGQTRPSRGARARGTAATERLSSSMQYAGRGQDRFVTAPPNPKQRRRRRNCASSAVAAARRRPITPRNDSIRPATPLRVGERSPRPQPWLVAGGSARSHDGRPQAAGASPETVFGASIGLGEIRARRGRRRSRCACPADMRSRMLTIPTSSPPSITGMCRNRRSLMIWAASLGE